MGTPEEGPTGLFFKRSPYDSDAHESLKTTAPYTLTSSKPSCKQITLADSDRGKGVESKVSLY